ncbi:MAG: hypothetical protein LIR46_07165 [Bacteroidota bacterium]|nr:hypothetical protein [Bacteroidota bacterium]
MSKKYYKLTEALYSDSDRLEVALRYRKGVGYEVTVTPVAVHYYNESNPDESSFYTAVEFNSFFSRINISKLVRPCKKRTVKAMDEAYDGFLQCERELVNSYLNAVALTTGRKIGIDESAQPIYGLSLIERI